MKEPRPEREADPEGTPRHAECRRPAAEGPGEAARRGRAGPPYIRPLAVSALAVLAATGLFNAAIDPFGMYRLIDLGDFNAAKPAIYHRVRLLKAYEVRRIRPQSVILGSSRVHLGFRPSHEGWAAAYPRRYNLAFDGATTREMHDYMLHADAAGDIEHVLLGLDNYHLTAAPGSTRPDFDPSLLLRPRHPLNVPRMVIADLKLLIGIDTLWASIDTIRSQTHPEPAWLAPDGQRLGDVFFRRPYEDFVTRGPQEYFDEIDRLEVGHKLAWRIPAAARRPANAGPPVEPDPVTSLGYVERIIEHCRARRIRLAIFLTPSHAHQLEIAAATGGWSDVENGKRALVEILARDAARHAGQPPVPFHDFSGYSSITTEPLPGKGSLREMRYYWESSHFKEVVGDMVLDRLLGASHAGREIPADFGVLLTPETIERAIAEDRERQASYRLSRPDEIATIAERVRNYKEEHGIVD